MNPVHASCSIQRTEPRGEYAVSYLYRHTFFFRYFYTRPSAYKTDRAGIPEISLCPPAPPEADRLPYPLLALSRRHPAATKQQWHPLLNNPVGSVCPTPCKVKNDEGFLVSSIECEQPGRSCQVAHTPPPSAILIFRPVLEQIWIYP